MALVVKNPPANAGDSRDVGLIPGLGRFPGGEHGNPLLYSCLENPIDRGTWWAMVHRVSKSWIWLKWLNMHINWYLVSYTLHPLSKIQTEWPFKKLNLIISLFFGKIFQCPQFFGRVGWGVETQISVHVRQSSLWFSPAHFSCLSLFFVYSIFCSIFLPHQITLGFFILHTWIIHAFNLKFSLHHIDSLC